jgi:hypothetical protein
MSSSNQKILAFFSKFYNQPFELVVVTDINIKEHPNYYKAIFKNIRTGKFFSQQITPEMMRYKYKVGHIYTNGEYVGQNKSLMKSKFRVNEYANLELVRLSSIINKSDAEIITYKDVNKYFLRQFAHVEQQEDYTLIIPCYNIANRFYFISSSMKKAVMNGDLGSLYYQGSFHPEQKENGDICVSLHIKKNAGKKDLPFICRFIGSSFSRNRFQYIHDQQLLSDYEYQPIRAKLPVNFAFDIYASYVYLGDDDRGKPKYLVLNIHSDNAVFGFQEIQYKQYSSKEDYKNILPENLPLPKPPKKRKFTRKSAKRDNKIYEGTPSSEYTMYTLYSNANDDYFSEQNLKVCGKNIYKENETELALDYVKGNIGSSFEKPITDGKDTLGPIQYSEDDPKKDKEIFNLKNFYQFYEALLTYAGVDGSELDEPYYINKIKNKKRNSSKSKSIIDGNESKSRRFLFGEFNYDGKDVCIAEIEHDDSWGSSTWIFIEPEAKFGYDGTNIQDIIEHYIREELSYTKLSEYVLENYGFIFEHKDHKKGNVDDIDIERWCENVLGRIFKI